MLTSTPPWGLLWASIAVLYEGQKLLSHLGQLRKVARLSGSKGGSSALCASSSGEVSCGLEEATARVESGRVPGSVCAPQGSSQRSGQSPGEFALTQSVGCLAHGQLCLLGPAVSGTPLAPTVMNSKQNIAKVPKTPSLGENGSTQTPSE